nr:MAG TPA: hypothetical protein [Caudoviricetes sp.]
MRFILPSARLIIDKVGRVGYYAINAYPPPATYRGYRRGNQRCIYGFVRLSFMTSHYDNH